MNASDRSGGCPRKRRPIHARKVPRHGRTSASAEPLVGPAETAEDWVAFARQQALLGGPHPVILRIARMPAADQDLIDEYLLDAGSRGEADGGALIERLHRQVLADMVGHQAFRVDLSTALAEALLQMAEAWGSAAGERR